MLQKLPLDALVAVSNLLLYMGRGGEIGIHKGLKIPRLRRHTGSSPVPGTRNLAESVHCVVDC